MIINTPLNYPRQQGFTLIEILIAVTIIAIFTAGITLSLFGRVGEARATKAKQDIATIESALQIYRLDNFRYPSQSHGLEALVSNPDNISSWRGPYIEKLPKDPWGSPYQYRIPGEKGKFDIYSLGADSSEGGSGEDADVSNWDDP